MQCTLLIPHLFWPSDTGEPVYAGLELPALSRLVARARAERFAALAPEAWLCQAFEVDKQQDWPVAPLTLELDGGDAGAHYWLRADPVHLRIERETVALVEGGLLDIDAHEAEALVASLNAQFQSDGLTFHARRPQRWYVSLLQAPKLATCSLTEAAGRDVRAFLPRGADARAWHRISNEAQMLLHGHAVNEAREASGRPALNSVWFWGGGTRPRVNGRPFTAVWSDGALASALAISAEASVAPLPRDAEAWLAAAAKDPDGRHLIVLDTLARAATYKDADAWRERVRALEAAWFAPLLEALNARAVAQLACVALLESACWRFDLRRSDLRKFWRTGQPLARYA